MTVESFLFVAAVLMKDALVSRDSRYRGGNHGFFLGECCMFFVCRHPGILIPILSMRKGCPLGRLNDLVGVATRYSKRIALVMSFFALNVGRFGSRAAPLSPSRETTTQRGNAYCCSIRDLPRRILQLSFSCVKQVVQKCFNVVANVRFHYLCSRVNS